MAKSDYLVAGKLKLRCLRLLRNGTLSANEVAVQSGVARATIYKWAKEAEINIDAARNKAAGRLWERGR